METAFDWITLGIFCGLIVLFLNRSSQEEPGDHLWQYLVAAVGCALANYLGNNEQQVAGAAVIVAVLAYIVVILKPIPNWPPR